MWRVDNEDMPWRVLRLDDQGQERLQLLAACSSGRCARAAYDAALESMPTSHVELRQGIRVVHRRASPFAKTKRPPPA